MKARARFNALALPPLLLISIIALIVLALLLASLEAFSKLGLGVYLGNRWSPYEDVYGGFAAIYGSLVVTAIAVGLAMPLALSMAVFSNEFSPRWLRPVLVNVGDLIASFPAVLFGLWGLLSLAPLLKGTLFSWLYGQLGWIPLFSTRPYGPSYLLASLVLAIMITPFASSLIREAYAQAPRAMVEGVYALGLGKWEAIRVTLAYTRAQVLGGLALALGRAMGETVAVAMTVGGAFNVSASLLAPGLTIPALIVNQFGSSYYPSLQASALFSLALLLFLLGLGLLTLFKRILGGGGGAG